MEMSIILKLQIKRVKVVDMVWGRFTPAQVLLPALLCPQPGG